MRQRDPKVHDLPLVVTFIPYLSNITKLDLSDESLQFLTHVESNICNIPNSYSSLIFDFSEVLIISDEFKTRLVNVLTKYYSVEAVQEKVKFINVPTRVKEAQYYLDEDGNFVLSVITKV